ncbi:MAG TPA: hypothetical protein VN667_01265 [Burkholderiales bacterium]|nr:hypothetical protein [Burkholderiales bacterium]
MVADPQPIARQSEEAPRDYPSVLLEVYGAMQGVRGVKEICNEGFPEFRAQNEAAHAKWLEDYKDVRLEVVRRVDSLVDSEAGGDARKKAAIRDDLRKEYTELKKGLREQYQGYGQERFRAACQQYPQMTAGDSVNIPKVYETQLGIIRRTPLEPVRQVAVAETRPAKSAARATRAAKASKGAKHPKAKSAKPAKKKKPAGKAKRVSGKDAAKSTTKTTKSSAAKTSGAKTSARPADKQD